jgi:membrane fusion protein, multidrug efflux system
MSSRRVLIRPFVAFAALAALVAPAAAGCHAKAEKASLPPPSDVLPTVRVIKSADRPEAGAAKVTGAVRSKNEATLSAKLTAQLKRVNVGVGDRVRAGQVLAELDAANAAIQLQNAAAGEHLAVTRIASTKLDLERATALTKSGSIASAELDRAQTAFDLAGAQLDQARAAVRAAQQQIRDATIVAPFDGVVSAKMKNTGDTVASMPPTPIVTVTDIDHLEVRLGVPEALVAFAQPGEALRGTVSPSGAPFEAAVRVAGSVVEQGTRTVEVLADLPSPPPAALRPGSLVTVDFTQAAMVGAYLPTFAVQREAGKSFVLVLDGQAVQRREVIVTPIGPGTLHVTQGLAAGELVAIDESKGLRSGDKVAVMTD